MNDSLNSTGTNRRNIILLLLILPVLQSVIGLIAHFEYGYFYQRITDPEYFHLLNGINVAIFNLATPYIDHPGTPLQVIVAVSSWPVSLFIPGSIVENAIDQPELFITAAIILMSIIISGVLFYAGKKVYSYTGNIFMTLLIQLIPFGNIYAFSVFGRLTPESFMIAPILLTVVILIRYLYNETEEKISRKELLYLSLLGGFGMAIKFSYLPFLLIPIFIIKRFPLLIKYGVYTILSTLIFAFPILFNFSKAFNWFGNMLIKSGQWGDGQEVFINWVDVPNNLRLIFNMNYFLPILTIIVLVLIIVTSVKSLKETQKLNRISSGVLLAILLSVFLITKHFAFRYYFPTLLFQAVLLVLIIEYLARLFQNFLSKKKLSLVILAFFFGFILYQTPAYIKKVKDTSIEYKLYDQHSESFTNSIVDPAPLIIDSYFAGSPFIEFSLNNAYLLCGNLKTTFQDKLRKDYPNSFFYVRWSDQFFHWNHFLDADSFIDKDNGAYLFIGEENENNKKIIIDRISSSFPQYNIETHVVYETTNPKESLYRVSLTQKNINH